MWSNLTTVVENITLGSYGNGRGRFYNSFIPFFPLLRALQLACSLCLFITPPWENVGIILCPSHLGKCGPPKLAWNCWLLVMFKRCLKTQPRVEVSRPHNRRLPLTISHFSGASLLLQCLIGDGGTNPLILPFLFSIWTSFFPTYRAELNQQLR